MDPYQILGISPSASDDEVKQAYRTLSKKYHPDANINNAHQAEYTEKFKQVQNAYKTIIDSRKRGFTNQNYGAGQGQSQSTYQYNGNEQAAFNDAAAYINAGRFQDALNILEQIRTRNSMWFYYSALAMNGVGNNATALEYAKTAAQMEPGNLQYLFLVQQLQAGSGQYRSAQQSYGSPFAGTANCCYSILMMNLCLSCCCR
ncbi:J domain-containing protein [Candidatus Stoquefichus sp. SB1]|jgi:molecular chaperone DnaJ|uniref:J domain-containing protein n=1 Tax=Candidatus Stoquefichus sp. SB1 TaxID=1658109 RepID=UPI00067EE3AB|nr:DnaJ domain-containing protein [Candidatus Stoquefichus sp. SB1]